MPVTAINASNLAYDAELGGWVKVYENSFSHTPAAALAVDYTKGDESRLDLTFGFKMTSDETIYRLSERDYSDEIGDLAMSVTATGKRVLPVPLPSSIEKLIIYPDFVDSGAGEGDLALDARNW